MSNFMSRKRNENKVRKKQIRYCGTNNFMPHCKEFNFSDYCKKMPPVQREISNTQRDKVYIRQEMWLVLDFSENIQFFSRRKKVAYCKVAKVGTNSWGSFFARAGGASEACK